MYLHPRDVVRAHLQQYGTQLSTFRGSLDAGIQEAAAYWEEKFPRFREMDPCSRANHIRTFVGADWREDATQEEVLTLDVRFNSGLHLYTAAGKRMRTKTRPRNPKNGNPLEIASWGPQTDLFGEEITPGYELAVLWEIDFRTTTLATATLAAIDFGPKDNGPVIIYAEEEIPALSTSATNSDNDVRQEDGSQSGGPGQDDFNEFLHDRNEDYGSDPA